MLELYLREVEGEKVLVGDMSLGVVAGDLMGVTGVLTEDLSQYEYELAMVRWVLTIHSLYTIPSPTTSRREITKV